LDRFIVYFLQQCKIPIMNLKSSLDRFIGLERLDR